MSLRIADGPAAFLAACERALAEDSPEARRRRSKAMEAEPSLDVVPH